MVSRGSAGTRANHAIAKVSAARRIAARPQLPGAGSAPVIIDVTRDSVLRSALDWLPGNPGRRW